MAYLAKSTVLKAYQLLSDIDSDKRQGLTQKVSALKYASALDIYFKMHHQNCDLKQSSNKDLFASYVGEIVKINDEYCTKGFFLSVSPNGRDYDCGSNFFSQTSVKDSKTNSYKTFLYPKRSGWQPIMDIQNQVLVYRSDYLHNAFSSYLGSAEQRLAFIVWLLRFAEIAEDNMDGIKSALNNLFTNEYCDALYTDAVNLSDTSYIEFDEKMCELTPDDIQSLFNAPEELSCEKTTLTDLPLQTIFYGAPGTGKSRTIKCEVEDKGRIHFRTTFHPDSDYSTFVGCYKPTTSKGKAESKIYSKEELVNILKQIKESGISYPYHKFAYKYWKSVKSLTTAEKKEVLSEAGSSENYSVEFDKAAILGEEYSNTSSTITYQFVPQAFTKAYCEAWNNYNPEGESEPVFLIIEEINRGNCAQIFGDIFQLLDRKDNGYSDYPIDADEDLKAFLENGVKEDGTPWLTNKDGIKDGKLCLPANLHIWATMNTSDQSLFPIDSAFKRRWDWEYVPIKRADKEPEKEWIIKVTHGGKTYWCYWWEFLEAINHQIEETTHSEDKQLGYFFAKPKAGENFISTDTFVNKVIFYLWNDVFKDEDSAVFQYDNDKVEDVSINRSGTMYFRHFMENKDEMIHYFINQLFAMGKDSTPAVPIDYLKNDADSKVAEHLPRMRELKVESPSAEENSDEKSDDADSK